MMSVTHLISNILIGFHIAYTVLV